MPPRTPLAFLSYAHDDDAHEQGKLREFARRLAGEVRLQSGEEFPIFVDRDHISWGHQWESRIGKSLDGATFLIPILTPGYFKSEYCRNECLHFLEREKKLKRKDLILPVYYVRCPVLEDDAKRKADVLAQVLHERQYADWRPRRHEPWTTPEVSRHFEQMALRIVEVLEQGGLAQPAEDAPAAMAETKPTPVAVGQVETAPERRSDLREPHTVVVDALHRGQYTSISQAIGNEPAGTRILVRPGHYREGLVIDKPLEIVGDGNRDDVVVEANGSSVIDFSATMGRLTNLTLRQTGGDNLFGVDIAGRLDLEDCDISSQSASAIVIHNGADPRVRRNRIHDTRQLGIFVCDGGAGLLEDNEIFGNTLSGIGIATGGNPTVRRNRIHNNDQAGLAVFDNGLGLLEDNEVFLNARSGIGVLTGSDPAAKRNRIHDNGECGILVYQNGAGLFEDNDILANGFSGVAVADGGDPVCRGNRIRGNREGVQVSDAGRGTFEKNVFGQNKTGAWDIAPDCEANVKRSDNLE